MSTIHLLYISVQEHDMRNCLGDVFLSQCRLYPDDEFHGGLARPADRVVVFLECGFGRAARNTLFVRGGLFENVCGVDDKRRVLLLLLNEGSEMSVRERATSQAGLSPRNVVASVQECVFST
jgi:hypothetical protein